MGKAKPIKRIKWWRPVSALALLLASASLALSIWNMSRRSATVQDAAPRLSIANLVAAVKRQLKITQEEAERAREDYFFYTRQLDLELNFVVTKSVDGGGNVRLWVVEASASGSYEDSQVQKIRLTFDTLLSKDAMSYYALSHGFKSAQEPAFRKWFSDQLKKAPTMGAGM